VTRLTDFYGNVRLVFLSDESDRAGLCASCTHMRRIVSDRGSVFYLCELSKTDPRFPKYPRLPVLVCTGFERLLGE
jgi:hypothetical protein